MGSFSSAMSLLALNSGVLRFVIVFPLLW
jgi:hypothetical protein